LPTRPPAGGTGEAWARLGGGRTRATFLSYTEQEQADFTAELTALLEPGSHIDLIQDSFLAMAPRAS
jgi:hypothetical protein